MNKLFVLLLFCLLATKSFAAKEFQPCDSITQKEISSNSIYSGKDAYCAFRHASKNANDKAAFIKFLIGLSGLIMGNVFGEDGEESLRSAEYLRSEAKLTSNINCENVLLALANKYENEAQIVFPTVMGFVGIGFLAGAYFQFNDTEPTGEIKDALGSADKVLLKGAGGPKDWEDFFELPQQEAIAVLKNNRELNSFLYETWQSFYPTYIAASKKQGKKSAMLK